MEASKILSAPLIDLIFDGRNKNYGAYELRKTNSIRTKTALSVTISIVALVCSIVSMASSSKKKITDYRIGPVMELKDVEMEKPPEKLPEPEKLPKPEPVETKQFTPPAIVDDKDFEKPLPDIASLDSAEIGLKDVKGKPPGVEDPPKTPDDGKDIIPPKENIESDEPMTTVEVPARFKENWPKFLLRNLNPETPVEHNAGPGRYSVVMQFVVDKEGNVSDIKQLTNHGYGMEEEAVRVLKKSPQWEPAIQNGHKVKAYHRQVITFEVNEE
ncbi:MAG TPA: energy transducer TonB [Chitinophagaceae bacterium]|jgi:protein TonB|nr:energy transducer TonB [Chitinophagaceae bacterium]